VRKTFLHKITHKKLTAFFAVFVLLFSLKGLILCHEGGQDYVLEFKYSPCCYKVSVNKTSVPVLKKGEVKYQSDFCVDYDISVFSHIVQNKVKFVKFFAPLSIFSFFSSKVFDTACLSGFLKQVYFVKLLNKIISSTVLLI